MIFIARCFAQLLRLLSVTRLPTSFLVTVLLVALVLVLLAALGVLDLGLLVRIAALAQPFLAFVLGVASDVPS